MGDSAYDFLGMIIDSAGGSACDRMAFKVYALQRLHASSSALSHQPGPQSHFLSTEGGGGSVFIICEG